jgi:hypothetical protein
MYRIRRVWETKPREARAVATLVAKVGHIYEKAGQRGPSTVTFNGGTVPGKPNRVYMEWTEEVINSPYRGENEFPEMGDLGQQIRDRTDRSWIDFYELMTPDKEQARD